MQRIREQSRETFSMGGDVRYVSVYVFNTLKRRTVWFMLPIAMAWPVCQPMRARENHTMSMETSHVHTHKRRERERERALTHRAGAYHIDGATVSSTMNNVKNAVYKRLAQAHTIRLSLNRNNTCISRMISAEYDVLYAFVPNQMDESCSIVCTNQVVQFFFSLVSSGCQNKKIGKCDGSKIRAKLLNFQEWLLFSSVIYSFQSFFSSPFSVCFGLVFLDNEKWWCACIRSLKSTDKHIWQCAYMRFEYTNEYANRMQNVWHAFRN